MKTFTIRTPGALMYVEVPFKGVTHYFKPSHSGPPYNTIVTVLLDEDKDQITVTDDQGVTFTEFFLADLGIKIENPDNVPGSSEFDGIRTFYVE